MSAAVNLHLHISSAEVRQDIADTEREIRVSEQEARAYEMFPAGSSEFRMAQFKARALRDGIAARKEFVEKLKAILKGRGEEP